MQLRFVIFFLLSCMGRILWLLTSYNLCDSWRINVDVSINEIRVYIWGKQCGRASTWFLRCFNVAGSCFFRYNATELRKPCCLCLLTFLQISSELRNGRFYASLWCYSVQSLTVIHLNAVSGLFKPAHDRRRYLWLTCVGVWYNCIYVQSRVWHSYGPADTVVSCLTGPLGLLSEWGPWPWLSVIWQMTEMRGTFLSLGLQFSECDNALVFLPCATPQLASGREDSRFGDTVLSVPVYWASLLQKGSSKPGFSFLPNHHILFRCRDFIFRLVPYLSVILNFNIKFFGTLVTDFFDILRPGHRRNMPLIRVAFKAERALLFLSLWIRPEIIVYVRNLKHYLARTSSSFCCEGILRILKECFILNGFHRRSVVSAMNVQNIDYANLPRFTSFNLEDLLWIWLRQ